MTSPLVLIVVGVGMVVVCVLAMAVLIARSWRSVEPGKAMIVSRMKAEPIVTLTGAMVLPVLHRAEVVDLSVQKLVVDRRGASGVICKDNLRADLEVTFFLRVNNTTDDILRVAQTVGAGRASDPQVMKELFVGKLSEAIKTVARQLDFEELYGRRSDFKDQVIQVIGRDLNGYVLDDAVIDYLEQTPIEKLDPSNVLDAQGIRKIVSMTGVSRERAIELARERGQPGAAAVRRWSTELERHGLLDVAVAVEVSCAAHADHRPRSLVIEGATEEVMAQLPDRLPAAAVIAAGAGTLTCTPGRATFRWSDGDVTDAQVVAGARLVHAFRDDPAATYR